MARFVPAHLRPLTYLAAAIAAFIGALVWAFRYDAADTASARQQALVTVGVLVVLAFVNIVLWARADRRPQAPKPARPETAISLFVAPALAGVVLACAVSFGYVSTVTAAPVENPAHQPILVFANTEATLTGTGVWTMPVAAQPGTGVYPVADPR